MLCVLFRYCKPYEREEWDKIKSSETKVRQKHKQVQKISLFRLFILVIKSMLGSRNRWSHLFLTITTQRILNELLIFTYLYWQVKNQANFFVFFCSGDKADLKILQCDWLRAFWQTYIGRKRVKPTPFSQAPIYSTQLSLNMKP